jgi:hypothetical protein
VKVKLGNGLPNSRAVIHAEVERVGSG